MFVHSGLQLMWRKVTRRPLIILLSTGMGAAIILGFLLHPYAATQAASIPTDRYHLTGLTARVTIFYDATGMPHILASSEPDGYTGLCWAEAHDRLFQLDELRRASLGRLTEIFGAGPDESVLLQDELFRSLGLAQLAQTKYAASSAAVQADLTACARGINAFITSAEAQHSLPLEFSDLGYSPDPWEAWQGELIATYFASALESNVYLAKIERAALLAQAGPAVANALLPDPPDTPSLFDRTGALNPLSQFLAANRSGDVFTLPAPLATPRAKTGEKRELLLAPLQHLAELQASTWANVLLGGDRASNNFAVDGFLTASGKPLLANDPHLQLATPSLFYLAQLTVRHSFSVEGITIPGFPVFISGHTASLSFGATYSDIDEVDVYAETIRETASGEQVLSGGQWVPVQSHRETFQIVGAASVTLNIRTTPHGPILNDALPSLNALGTLALKAVVAQPAWTVDGFFALPKVTSWQGFRTALASESIGLNFLFADTRGRHGHIGYQMAGLAPQRQSMENTLVPVPGGDSAHEWVGYATFDQLPSVYNPPSHILETSNNRMVPSAYAPGGAPIYISRYYDLPWRSERATTLLLQAGNHITARDLARVQLDTQTTVGKPITADLIAALQRIGLPANDPDAAASLAQLRLWNGNASSNSLGATIYETLVAVLDRDVVTYLLGPGAYQAYTQGVFVTTQIQALQTLLEAPQAPFFGAATDAQAPAGRDQAVQAALQETDALLHTALGNDHTTWSWGRLHTLTYNHPLASVDPRFDIGTFPAIGDGETVNTGGWETRIGLLEVPPDQLAQVGGAQAVFAQDALATARVVWDMSNFDHSLGVLDTGESGDPTCRHWSDQAALWRSGQYNRLPYSNRAIEEASQEAILLD
jgi:penicillin amidase